LKCAPQPKIAKINKTPYLESSGSFKVIDVNTTKKLVTSAWRDRQHAHAYLQPFSRKTGQQRQNNDFYGDTVLWCPRAQVSLRIETWTAKIYVPCWKCLMQRILVLVYLYLCQRNSLLKCTLQSKIAKKSIKNIYF